MRILKEIIDNANRNNESVPQAMARFYQSLPELLLGAVESNNLDQVRELLFEKADPNTRTNDGCTILIKAICDHKNINIINALLEAGADVNLFSRGDGITMTITSSRYGHTAPVRTSSKKTPLHHAAEVNYPEAISCVLPYNMKHIDAQTEPDGFTPLMCAVKSNSEAAFHLLIQSGATLTIRDLQGRTIIEHIVESGRLDRLNVVRAKLQEIELYQQNVQEFALRFPQIQNEINTRSNNWRAPVANNYSELRNRQREARQETNLSQTNSEQRETLVAMSIDASTTFSI